MSSLRQVQAGRQYQLPPPVNGVPPSPQEPLDTWRDNITRAAALAAAEQAAAPSKKAAAAAAASSTVASAPRETVLAGATRAYMGVSPALVEELCATASISPAASPDSLTPESWQALHAAWQAWLGRLHSGNFAPSSCPATGKFSVIDSYSQPHESAHDMVEGYYRSLQAGEVYAGLHTRLSTAVKAALKKARGRVKAFEQQLQAADEVAAVQKQADIIVANMYRCVTACSAACANINMEHDATDMQPPMLTGVGCGACRGPCMLTQQLLLPTTLLLDLSLLSWTFLTNGNCGGICGASNNRLSAKCILSNCSLPSPSPSTTHAGCSQMHRSWRRRTGTQASRWSLPWTR